jgi:hypothetical protein
LCTTRAVESAPLMHQDAAHSVGFDQADEVQWPLSAVTAR